ncbi:hypothetical protein NW762_013989 [Fusarium torreyae]|uniref:Ankyrin repeat protein n=1 Tax=Fusarium torreyae TaxID=1237075 RepID=A0A9W8RJJ3_9HYPO|nr:hypothetical protein NW762_013989 [Fusarium torreyae]
MSFDDAVIVLAPPEVNSPSIDETHSKAPTDELADGTIKGIRDVKGKPDPLLFLEIVQQMAKDDELARHIGLGRLCACLKKDRTNINAANDSGETALQVAIDKGLSDAALVLIAFGANVSAKDKDGQQPLHIACLKGNKAIAEVLLTEGANIDARNHKQVTPLDEACWKGHIDVVDLLLTKGADVLVEDVDGWSPLYSASLYDRKDVVQRLLKKDKSNINHIVPLNGWNALHIAIHNDCENVASHLIERGVMLNTRDNDGWTALHLAIRSGHRNIVSQLLEEGPAIDIRDDQDWTALHYASWFADGAMVNELLEKGAMKMIDWGDEEDRTALHLAINLLLDKKARIDVRDKNGNTALHLAAGDHDAINSQPDSGQSSGTPSTKKNASQSAVVQLLLDAGADPTVTNNDTKTPIDIIMTRDDPGSFQGLLIHLCRRAHSTEKIQQPSASRSLGLDELLVREEFAPLLSRVIHQSIRSQATNETLETALTMVLDIVEDWKKVEIALVAYRRLSSKFLAQRKIEIDPEFLKGCRKSTKKPRPEKSNNIEQSEPKQTDLKDRSLVTLNDIRDILRDPPYSQLYRYDHSEFKIPEAEKGTKTLLERFETSVVQFHRCSERARAVRRYRSAKEMIYGDGPTKTTQVAMESLEKWGQNNTSRPKFIWVHLPANNMVWMKDLLVRIVKEEGYKAEQYYELESFFQNSWTQTSGCEPSSRTMKPCVVRRQRDPAKRQSSKKKRWSIRASAVYMPYFGFSTQRKEHASLRDDQERSTAYDELLQVYKEQFINGPLTLDEWYYDSAEDGGSLEDRISHSKQQVVTEFFDEQKRSEENAQNKTAKKASTVEREDKEVKDNDPDDPDQWTLLRVNHIWIWVVANKWVISASSCSLDDTHDSLVERILDDFRKRTEFGGKESQPASAEGMSKMIVDHCVAAYERKPRSGLKTSIGQMCSNYINRIERDEVEYFKRLRLSRTAASDTQPLKFSAKDSLNSTELAEKLLCDINNIQNNLKMLRSVAQSQKKVQRDLAGKQVKDAELSADYVENNIIDMDTIADRVRSAAYQE